MAKTVVYKVGGERTTKAAYEKALAEGRTDVEKILYQEDGVEVHMVPESEEAATTSHEVEENNDELKELIVVENGDDGNDDENGVNRSNWLVIMLVILVIGLAGHLIWCLVHHINNVQPTYYMCTACNKEESDCECNQIRADLTKQIAKLQAQLEQQHASPTVSAPVEVRIEICKICGKETCDCAKRYNTMKERIECFDKMLCSGECYGLCTVHCAEKATATPTMKPTVKPTATPTMKPTVKPTATPTMKPTVKPTATPTVKPTATPTVKPTEAPCTHPTAIVSRGEKKWNGEKWTQEVWETCANCGQTIKTYTDSGVCKHETTEVIKGEKQIFSEYDWLQEVWEVCQVCGTTVDSWYNVGSYEDIAIPSNPNSWEYDDDSEAAKPVS